MGAEVSKATAADGMRRVESASALEAALSIRAPNSGVSEIADDPLSARGGGQARRNSLNSNSSASSRGGASKDGSLMSARSASQHRSGTALGAATNLSVGEENAVESLDLPIVEWEGYVTKRGHLVRNWKMRFFTLEGNLVSYYENKVDARNRAHLKGRVNVASVKVEKVSKAGSGFDFSFETTEGKVFHCAVATEADRVAWIYFLEAGVDCNNMRKNNKPIYNTYRHGALPDMTTPHAYELYQKLVSGEHEPVTEFLSYFNKGKLRDHSWLRAI